MQILNLSCIYLKKSVKYSTDRVNARGVWHMMSNDFEEALDLFLAGTESDEAHQALYDIIRAAFLAGWRSAGGESPQEQRLFQLLPGGKPTGKTE